MVAPLIEAHALVILRNMKLGEAAVKAASEAEAVSKVLGNDLEGIIYHKTPKDKKTCRITITKNQETIKEELQFLFDKYEIIQELDGNSALLVQTKPHVMKQLTYNVKEPMRITSSTDTINIVEYTAKKVNESTYRVTESYTLKQRKSNILMFSNPDL